MLAYRALGWVRRRARAGRGSLGAVLIAVGCATLDELHQTLTLTRSGRARDVLIDGVGAFAGALVGGWYLFRRRPRPT